MGVFFFFFPPIEFGLHIYKYIFYAINNVLNENIIILYFNIIVISIRT